jgi:hypothetical protein
VNNKLRKRLGSFVITCLAASAAQAGVLPEDRADILYFRYEGGGVTIDGPSVLARKSIGEHVSVQANHYIDMVSSASVDVETSASPYEDERTQSSLSIDFLHGKSMYSLGAVKSDESDYIANTVFAGVSHDMFGDLTTISFGYKRGKNDVFRNVQGQRDLAFQEEMETQSFNVSLSQIITKNLLISGQYEVITDEGFLRSPYRSVRFFIDPFSQGRQDEIYPNTRSSNAASIRAKYFLPYRAAIDGMYRFYTDTWGVLGHTGELGYVHPLDSPWAGGNWILEGRVRYYQQEAADFYQDIFPRADFANFMARDKELATYNAITAGVSATYEFKIARMPWLSKGSLSLRYDYMTVNYDNFRDARFSLGSFGNLPAEPLAPGTEPLYKLNANIMQFYISAFF